MAFRRILRILAVGLSASLYLASPPQSPLQPERGPMRPRAVVRPPRLDLTPPPSSR
jgi:hypothetical protein